jgi:hypothetical protein
LVTVNAVVQSYDNYSVSGTTLTLGGTLNNDRVEILYVGRTFQTVSPAVGTVTNEMLSGSIANSKLANSSITLNGSAVSLGGSATVGGDNTPYFHAYKSADQNISSGSFTTVTFDTEEWDSGSNFASNTFTAPSTGYYWIYSQLVWSGAWSDDYTLNRFMKNGSPVSWTAIPQRSDNGFLNARVIYLSTSDTVIVQTYQESGSTRALRGGSEDECYFGGFKIIT